MKRSNKVIRQGINLTSITLGTDEDNFYKVYIPYRKRSRAKASLLRLRRYGAAYISTRHGKPCIVVNEIKNREQALELKKRLRKRGYKRARLFYTGFSTNNKKGPWEIRILSLNPKNIDLRIGIARDKIIGREKTSSIAKRFRAIAAINTDFFKPSGDLYSATKHRGIWYSEPDSKYASIGLYKQNGIQKVIMARLKFEGYAKLMGKRFTISGINRSRKKSDRGKLIYFNNFYDNDITIPKKCWGIVTTNGLIKRVEYGKKKIKLRRGEFLLIGDGKRSLIVKHCKVGRSAPVIFLRTKPVDGRFKRIWESCSEILSGSHILVNKGRIVVPNRFLTGFIKSRHPRTALAVKRDGTILLVTVDGRKAGYSVGMTLREWAVMLKKIGAYNAINFDGGGSTTMVVNGRTVNYTSDGRERAVGAALLVF